MQLRATSVTSGLQAIIFDHDGTILDTESAEYESVRRVWHDYGLSFLPERWAHVIGTVSGDPWIDELARELGRSIDRDEIYRRARRYNAEALESVDARPGIRELVATAAAAGIPMAIASNAPVSWIERRVGPLGFYDAFDYVIGVDTASAPKPDPAPFAEACMALGVDPRFTVAIEDSNTGVASAVAAGCFTLACPGPLTLGHDLSAAHVIVDSHTEVTLGWLSAQLAAWHTAG